MRVLGVLQCEGLLVRKNAKAGCKNLLRATQWGNIPAALALLKYSGSDKIEIVKALNASVRKTPYDFLADTVKEKYGIEEDGVAEGVVLLRKAFSVGILKDDMYVPTYKRLAFSPAIGYADKEKLLLSEDKLSHCEAFDLPLQLTYREFVAQKSAWEGRALDRPDEIGNVKNALNAIDLRAFDFYRPMCFVTDSDFVAEYYADVLEQSLAPAGIRRISVADLTDYDFESSKNNVFLRDIDEKGNNVRILFFRGKVSDYIVDLVKNFLRAERRRTFHINRPAITIDLSSVLSVCVCDKENAKKLEGLVEYVELAPVADSEKPALIKELIAKKGALYGMKDVVVTDGAVAELCKLPPEKAATVLDGALRANRHGEGSFTLTEEIAAFHVGKVKGVKTGFGFGGSI